MSMTEEDLKEYEEAGTTALERKLIAELRQLWAELGPGRS